MALKGRNDVSRKPSIVKPRHGVVLWKADRGCEMKPEKAGNDFQPRGTLAVMALYALIILAVWLAIYFGLFLSRR